MAACVTCVFAVTLSVFPVVTVRVQTVYKDSAGWGEMPLFFTLLHSLCHCLSLSVTLHHFSSLHHSSSMFFALCHSVTLPHSVTLCHSSLFVTFLHSVILPHSSPTAVSDVSFITIHPKVLHEFHCSQPQGGSVHIQASLSQSVSVSGY